MVVDAIADRGRAPLGVACWTLSVEHFPLVNFLLETHSLPELARRYPCGFTFYVADPFAPFFLLNFYFVLFLDASCLAHARIAAEMPPAKNL
jgi:hypothetical protein